MDTQGEAAGLFDKYYGPLHGSGWLRTLPTEGRRQFSQLGLRALRLADLDLPKLGGQARVKTAERCPRGHLLPKSGGCRACARKSNQTTTD